MGWRQALQHFCGCQLPSYFAGQKGRRVLLSTDTRWMQSHKCLRMHTLLASSQGQGFPNLWVNL